MLNLDSYLALIAIGIRAKSLLCWFKSHLLVEHVYNETKHESHFGPKYCVQKAISGVEKMPEGMSVMRWQEINAKALSAIQLCLSNKVQRSEWWGV